MTINKTNEGKADIIIFKNMTLKEIVTNNFRTAAVFEKYGLDFCCRGNKLITTACEEKGINAIKILEELKTLTIQKIRDERYDEWTLDFLIDYIIQNHHSYVKEMLPIISVHTQKIASVHGTNHAEVIEIAKKFEGVAQEFRQHLIKEEDILFPYIKQLVQVNSRHAKAEAPFFGTVKNPIKSMMAEHENAGDEFYEIRNLSSSYTPPEDACNKFIAAYQELKDFEEDLHKHVHLENNILFPKAIELEKRLLS